ncbi:hypothetical protein PAXINDRAFT_13060 [Paxillus involutus ATCC 200175]|uniref:Retrotransposon gag domain-containing protein n=1 Tax=Paxillus involutus ATCC 200175 TaxID=664439 RepID=A0A0C9SX13_PAXIN|nr:hypothetical protein PAXINDRAFT_13060 [Paxillus involutus ATCC 200175]
MPPYLYGQPVTRRVLMPSTWAEVPFYNSKNMHPLAWLEMVEFHTSAEDPLMQVFFMGEKLIGPLRSWYDDLPDDVATFWPALRDEFTALCASQGYIYLKALQRTQTAVNGPPQPYVVQASPPPQPYITQAYASPWSTDMYISLQIRDYPMVGRQL